METEDVVKKSKFKKNAPVVIAILALIVIMALEILITTGYFSKTERHELTLGEETIYYSKVSSEDSFVDLVAWIDANGYELVDSSYPKNIFYLENGRLEAKVFENFDDYLDFLLKIKYSDDLKLHDDIGHPEYVIYKKK